MSTSHEWAKKLRETAEKLASCPEVHLSSLARASIYFWNGDKEKFLAAVRALKPGRKIIEKDYVRFIPDGTILELYIDRNAVCHKVQEAQYECEPLLSPQEDAEMEATADARQS